MYNIIVISENRGLLKRIWGFLRNQKQFVIHLVPFSTDAVDFFYTNHADLVILDTSVLLPYQEIITSFKTAPWEFGIILLNESDKTTELQQVVQLPIANLNMRNLLELIDKLIIYHTPQKSKVFTIDLEWLNIKKVTLLHDTYHMLWIKSYLTKIEDNSLRKLKKQLVEYCQLQIIEYTTSEVLILIKRSEIKQRINFNQVRQMITTLWGVTSLFVYEKNIAWQNLQSEIYYLKKVQQRSFFLSGQTMQMPITEKKYSTNVSKAVAEQCLALIKALFGGDLDIARQLLQDIYLHLVKQSCDFVVLEHVRLSLRLYLQLSHRIERVLLTFQNFSSIEEELTWILTNVTQMKPIVYRSPLIKETLCSCIDVIWLHFQESWSLENVANKMAINKIYLNRIFKEQFKYTILEVINWLRLEMAKSQLCYSSDAIAIVAARVGFQDVSYFGRFFKRACQLSPSVYRKKMQQQLEVKKYESDLASK